MSLTGNSNCRPTDHIDELLGVPIRVRMLDIGDPNTTVFDVAIPPLEDTLTARKEYDRAKRGFKIRIDHGCLLSCSYCAIRNATGRLHSVPEDRVLAAFIKAASRHEPSIMLLGGDTGAYGVDIGTRFTTLLEKLLAIDGTHQVFVHDLNVNWLVRDLISYERVVRRGSQRLRAMCLPVQSGSDAILCRMRRPYSIDDVMHALRAVKSAAPHTALGTHIIVGFPGETEADFQMSLRFLHDIEFDFITCFRYSEHPDASSARLDRKVPEAVKVNRLERLHALLGQRATIAK